MQVILDFLFSSVWLLLITLFAILIVTTNLAQKKFFKTKFLNLVFSGLMYTLFALSFLFGGFINPVYFGYGYATGFNKILANDKYVCFLDSRMAGGGDGDFGIEYHRLHTLNVLTGEKIYKKVLGKEVEYFEQKGGLLFYGGNSNSYLLNIENGETIKHFSKKTLPILYSELQSGIDAFQYDQKDSYIRITAKNGKVYYITPYDGKITSQLPAIAVDYKETYDTAQDSAYISLVAKKSSDKIFVLADRNGKVLNDSLEFLEGEMFHIFKDLNRFVVLHYTNTDKTTFILTCMSTDLKKVWEIRQTDLDSKHYWFKNQATLDVSIAYLHQLIFNIGGFAFAINGENGKIIWKEHL